MFNVAISGMKGIDLTKDAKSKDDKITTILFSHNKNIKLNQNSKKL